MSKTQEIKRLDAIIKNLPAESYLRATLVHIRVQFESDIRSDFETLPDLAEIQREKLAQEAAASSASRHVAKLLEDVRRLEAKADILKTKLQNYRQRLDDIAQDALNAKHHIPVEIL